MRVKTSSSYAFHTRLKLCLFAALLAAFALSVFFEKHIHHASKLRYQSLALAYELRQSSDALTKTALSYVLAGEPSYLTRYKDTLDIREGRKTQPVNDPVYAQWDAILANPRAANEGKTEGKTEGDKEGKTEGNKEHKDAPRALTDIMYRALASDEERSALASAKAASAEMIAVEMKAMSLVELARPAEAIAIRALALSTLSDKNYNRSATALSQHIATLYALIDKRTHADVAKAERRGALMRFIFSGLGLGVMFLLWRTYQLLRTTLGGSLEEVYAQITHLGAGDFSNRRVLAGGEHKNILAELAETRHELDALSHARLEAETAASASETRYNTLAELSTAGIWQIDRAGNTFYINKSMCDMLEVGGPAELAGHTYHGFFTPESLAVMATEHAKREAGEASNYEVELIGRRCGRRSLLVSGTPLLDKGGNLLGLLGTFQDITERKRAEEQLRHSEENLAITLASIGDAVIATDATGLITRMNLAAERLTGWSFAECVGRPLNSIFNIIRADTRAPVQSPVQLVMEHGSVVGLANHTVLIARNGTEYQIADSAAPIRNSLGDIVGVVLVFSDVTEKYRTENALRQADERFHQVFKLVPNPLTLQTTEGVLLDCSNAFCEMTGYSREEVLQRDVGQLDLWENPEQRKLMRDILLRDGKVDNFEFLVRRRDGEIRTMQLSVRIMTPETDPLLLSVAHDITELKEAEASLAQKSELLDRTGTLAKVGGWELELATMKLTWTRETFRISEVDTDTEPPLNEAINFYPPEARPTIESAVRAAIETATPYDLELPIVTAKGHNRWVRTQGFAELRNGKVTRIYGTFQDITARKHHELATLESARHTQTILDNMLDGVITINQHGIMESFNQAACHIFGYTADEAIGQNVSLLMPEPHRSRHDSYIQDHLNSGENHVLGKLREVTGRRKDGSLFPMSLSASKILRADEPMFIGLVRDITQQRQDEEKINRLAFYDPLTNLPNRRLLFDRLAQALINSTRTDQHGALMFLDLDYFKQLNDSLGHDLGDLLLQQVALRLHDCVREGDSVARMGGDEFVLLVEALSPYQNEAGNQAEAIAQKVLASLGKPFTLREHTYTITPSVGIVVFLHQDQTMEELLKKADLAMYQAKAAGRNSARFFDPAMRAAAAIRADLEKSMRKALEAGEFILHYQLQVDGKSRPTGVEALVRWCHSKHGMISPAAFIPLAEETGIILPLGQWVLETACAQLVKWAKIPAMKHWTMAVNVSVSQFAQADFVASLDKALSKTGANPRLLKLELTESMLVKDVDAVIVKMFEIKALGVTFSLDDFGTGYSSLSYLKRLPLDQLKIDQSFVRDLLTDTNDAVIARTIIALGHSLSLKVIAEGVETAEQRQTLADMGCDAFQGYYFARPVAEEGLKQAVNALPK